MTLPQSNPPVRGILIEQRYDADWEIDGQEAPCWIGLDAANSRPLWRTWSLNEAACCAACAEAYPDAMLVAVSTIVEKGGRL